jgi:AbrB family looped-hinge helix DNA binding protein
MDGVRLADLFGGAVTVGERGQVVVPAELRERLAIRAGDKLLAFAHPNAMGVVFLKIEKVMEAQQEVGIVLSRALEITSPTEAVEADGEGGAE